MLQASINRLRRFLFDIHIKPKWPEEIFLRHAANTADKTMVGFQAAGVPGEIEAKIGISKQGMLKIVEKEAVRIGRQDLVHQRGTDTRRTYDGHQRHFYAVALRLEIRQ